MKPIYVVLIALLTAIVSGAGGFIAGAALGGFGGVIGGAAIGICTTTEIARQQGLLTQEQEAKVIAQIKEKISQKYNLKPEDMAKLEL
ncbi:MAG: hypothetical protein ACREPR_20000, partial [Brasilonema sp.]